MDKFEKLKREKRSANAEITVFDKVMRMLSIAVIIVSLYVISTRLILFVRTKQFYSVREIKVIGLETFTKDDIIELGNLNKIKSIFNLNVQDAAERIQAHPRIRSARVFKELPDKLIVRIVEKTPAAIIVSNGILYTVDSDGYILAKEQFIKSFDYPVITGLKYKQLFPGNRVKNIILLGILKTLYRANTGGLDIRSILSEIHVSSGMHPFYTLYTDRSGIKVDAGSSVTIEKLRRLEAAYGYFEKHNMIVKNLDIRYKNATYKEI